MAERLTKKERKAQIAASMSNPLVTPSQLIKLNKMYDDLCGKTKKPGRPPKAKEPVAKDLTADEKVMELVYKLEAEREALERQKTPEQREQELKELRKKWDAERVYPGYRIVDERGNALSNEEITRRRNLAERAYEESHGRTGVRPSGKSFEA
jgi:hypothetical protein